MEQEENKLKKRKTMTKYVFNELLYFDNLPYYIFKIKKLHLLHRNNNFKVLDNFTYLKSLKSNEIPNNYLIKLTNIEELIIDGESITENYFSNLKKLKTLIVEDDYLINLNNLTELTIRGYNKLVGHFKNFTQLKSLKLIDCGNVLDNNFTNNIENLFINYCPKITCNFLQNFNQLQKLEIEITENNVYIKLIKF
ncbi:hypothetical protein ABK040_004319 [Willaertia magna]